MTSSAIGDAMGHDEMERLRRLAMMGDKSAAEDLLRARRRAGYDPIVRGGQALIEPDLWTPLPRSWRNDPRSRRKGSGDPLREEYDEILEEEQREGFEGVVGEARKRHQTKKISKSSADDMSDLFMYIVIPAIAAAGLYALYKISKR